jgi:hypothetical protein
MHHLFRACLALAITCAALFALLAITYADETLASPSAPVKDVYLYLPFIYSTTTPAGVYYCYEWEFGLIWTGEAITLNVDGSSIYAYDPPYAAIVTGTWVYTPSSEEVGFTNFRWLTATFQPPDYFWASKYLSDVGFEIAMSCSRLH